MAILIFLGAMLLVFVLCFLIVLTAMIRSAMLARVEKSKQSPTQPEPKPSTQPRAEKKAISLPFGKRRKVQEIQPPDFDELGQDTEGEKPYD